MKKSIMLIFTLFIILLCGCGAQNEPTNDESTQTNIISQSAYDLGYEAILTVDSYNNDEIFEGEAEEKLKQISDDLGEEYESAEDEIKHNILDIQIKVDEIWHAFTVLNTNQSREYLNNESSESMSNEECYKTIDTNTQQLVDLLNELEISE